MGIKKLLKSIMHSKEKYTTIASGQIVKIEGIALDPTGLTSMTNPCLYCILYNCSTNWIGKVAPYSCLYRERELLEKKLGKCTVDWNYKLKSGYKL